MIDAGLDYLTRHAETFYLIKGITSLVATVALVFLMVRIWPHTQGLGQQLRFLCLLYFAVLITAASVEQVNQEAVVNLRNLGALGGAVLLNITVAVSLRRRNL